MICPNCKYEYNPGVTKCPDCGADLVYALPPLSSHAPNEPESLAKTEIVYESDLGVDLAIAKEILDDAGILHIERRKPGFYSSSDRKTIIEVDERDAGRARSLLAELAEGGSRLAGSAEMEEEDFSDSLVIIFEPSDQAELSAARAILNRAGIDYEVIDNRHGDTGGRAPIEIQVFTGIADEARKLLARLKGDGSSSETQEPET